MVLKVNFKIGMSIGKVRGKVCVYIVICYVIVILDLSLIDYFVGGLSSVFRKY